MSFIPSSSSLFLPRGDVGSWTRPNICPKSISRGRDPSTCQKILTGSLYYSGIIVARFVSYQSGGFVLSFEWLSCVCIAYILYTRFRVNYIFLDRDISCGKFFVVCDFDLDSIRNYLLDRNFLTIFLTTDNINSR